MVGTKDEIINEYALLLKEKGVSYNAALAILDRFWSETR